MARLYKNRKGTEDQIKPVPQSATTRLHEGTITHEVMDILRRLREQLGRSRTAQQTKLDEIVRLVVPKMAFNDEGRGRLPLNNPKVQTTPTRWACLVYDVVRLIEGYYASVREGESDAFDFMKARWEHILDTGIDDLILVNYPPGPFYMLMSHEEWGIEQQRARDAAAAKQAERDARFAEREIEEDAE